VGKEWNRLNQVTGRNNISFADTQQLDGSGRLRVSTPLVLHAQKFEYSKDSHDVSEKLTGTAVSTHLPNESCVLMSVPNIGDEVIRQSREWYYYQPLNAQEIAATCIFGEHENGILKEHGYCSGSDGLLFRQYNGEYWIVLISSVGGDVPPVQAIPQSEWNIDRFQLNNKDKEFNPSGKMIDFSKFNITHLDVIWLGGDRSRVAFKYDGILYDAHEFLNAGKWSSPFMQSGSLPVRYRIKNESSLAGGSMKQVCFTVRSEGGNERFGVQHIAKVVNVPNIPAGTLLATPANPPYQPNFASYTPVLIIQANPTYYGLPNRAANKILEFEITVKGNVPALWALLHNPIIQQTPTALTWYRVADETSDIPSDMKWTTSTVAVNPITNPGHVHDFGTAASDVKGSVTGAGEINTRLIINRYTFDHTDDAKSDWYVLAIAGDGGVIQSVTAVLKWAELY